MLFTILSVAALVALDRITKILAVNLAGRGLVELVPGVVGLRLLEGGNTGAAFGMLSQHTWLLIVLSFVVSLVCLYLLLFKRFTAPFGKLGLLLITAGGIGNLYDRVVYGAVTDFIEFLFFQFPTFNVADCYVTVGAALLVLSTFFLREGEGFFVPTTHVTVDDAEEGKQSADDECESTSTVQDEVIEDDA